MATKPKRIRFTDRELSVILAAAGNIEPSMFEDNADEKTADLDRDAWESGQAKLRAMIAEREARKAARKKAS